MLDETAAHNRAGRGHGEIFEEADLAKALIGGEARLGKAENVGLSGVGARTKHEVLRGVVNPAHRR